MYLEIYLDLIFILNFIFDLILIILLKKINHKRSSRCRFIIAAAFGGLVAVIVSIFIWMNELVRFFLMYILASLLMILIAFGKMRLLELIRQVILLNLISFFVGGLINAIYYHTNFRMAVISLGKGVTLSNLPYKLVVIIFLLLLPLLILFLWLKRCYTKETPLTYTVELIHEDKRVVTTGLMDTGNLLYDPIFKKPVILVENNLLEQLLYPDFYKDIYKAKASLSDSNLDISQCDIEPKHLLKLRLIPYHSVGKSGTLIGVKLDKVLVHTEKNTSYNEKVIAAISDNSLSAKDKYHVVLHKELLNV